MDGKKGLRVLVLGIFLFALLSGFASAGLFDKTIDKYNVGNGITGNAVGDSYCYGINNYEGCDQYFGSGISLCETKGYCKVEGDLCVPKSCEEVGLDRCGGYGCSIKTVDESEQRFDNPKDNSGNGILISKYYYGDNYTNYALGYCESKGFDDFRDVVVVDDSAKACRCDDYWGCEGQSCISDVSLDFRWERIGSVTCIGDESENVSLCGNGVLELEEECDDGNLVKGDGCSSSCLKEENLSCTDSDGGLSRYTKGETCFGDQCQEDYCEIPTAVKEFYCDEVTGGLKNVLLTCVSPNKTTGCLNGACISNNDSSYCDDKKCVLYEADEVHFGNYAVFINSFESVLPTNSVNLTVQGLKGYQLKTVLVEGETKTFNGGDLVLTLGEVNLDQSKIVFDYSFSECSSDFDCSINEECVSGSCESIGISECDYLTDDVREEVAFLRTQNANIAFEGGEMRLNDYLVVPYGNSSKLLRFFWIYNTASSYSNNKVGFEDVLSNEVYYSTFTSTDKAYIYFGDDRYNLNVSGLGLGSYIVIDSPPVNFEECLLVSDSEGGSCDSGECFLDGKCYPLGYRKSGEFCSDSDLFIEQLGNDEICENNFECDSNLCIDGQCVESGLFTRFISWFRNLFG